MPYLLSSTFLFYNSGTATAVCGLKVCLLPSILHGSGAQRPYSFKRLEELYSTTQYSIREPQKLHLCLCHKHSLDSERVYGAVPSGSTGRYLSLENGSTGRYFKTLCLLTTHGAPALIFPLIFLLLLLVLVIYFYLHTIVFYLYIL